MNFVQFTCLFICFVTGRGLSIYFVATFRFIGGSPTHRRVTLHTDLPFRVSRYPTPVLHWDLFAWTSSDDSRLPTPTPFLPFSLSSHQVLLHRASSLHTFRPNPLRSSCLHGNPGTCPGPVSGTPVGREKSPLSSFVRRTTRLHENFLQRNRGPTCWFPPLETHPLL